jgi:hypothetical protein
MTSKPNNSRTWTAKGGVEKSLSLMKSNMDIRPISIWTANGGRGVLLIGFLAQALISGTCLLAKLVYSRATKFITDYMQKLILTLRRSDIEVIEDILSNFNLINIAIMKGFGMISKIGKCDST